MDWLWNPKTSKARTVLLSHFTSKWPCTIFCPQFNSQLSCLVVNKLIESFSSSFRKRVWFEHGQGQNSEQKHKTTKHVEFHNHLHILTMIWFNQSFIEWALCNVDALPMLAFCVCFTCHRWSKLFNIRVSHFEIRVSLCNIRVALCGISLGSTTAHSSLNMQVLPQGAHTICLCKRL